MAALLSSIRASAQLLDVDVLRFWLAHGLDAPYGGFVATLARNRSAAPPTDKSVMAQVCDFSRALQLATETKFEWCHMGS